MGYLVAFIIGEVAGVIALALYCCLAINKEDKKPFGRNYWKREALKWCDKSFEYVKQLAEGVMIKMPCKVGDTVYCIDADQDLIEESKVLSIEYYLPSHDYFVRSERMMFYNDDVGKQVFFSKDEAEAFLGMGNRV